MNISDLKVGDSLYLIRFDGKEIIKEKAKIDKISDTRNGKKFYVNYENDDYDDDEDDYYDEHIKEYDINNISANPIISTDIPTGIQLLREALKKNIGIYTKVLETMEEQLKTVDKAFNKYEIPKSLAMSIIAYLIGKQDGLNTIDIELSEDFANIENIVVGIFEDWIMDLDSKSIIEYTKERLRKKSYV